MIYSFRSYSLPYQGRPGRDTGVGSHIVRTLRKQNELNARSLYAFPFSIQSTTTVYGMVLFAFRGLFLPQLKASLNMLTEPPILAFLNFQVNFPDPLNLPIFHACKTSTMYRTLPNSDGSSKCHLAHSKYSHSSFCMIYLRKDFHRQLFLSI